MRPYYHDEAAGITIVHGDCRALTLPERPALVLTDPPYGMALDTDYSGFNGWTGKGKKYAPVEGDNEPFDPTPLLVLDTKTILWGGNHYASRLPDSGGWFVWNKRGEGKPSEICFGDAELAWTNLQKSVRMFSYMWHGVARWTKEPTYHPTQKPVALMRWCLQKARLAPGALVYDPYMGSGPVAQACKELGYRYLGVELVEAYCEIAARRLSQEVMALEG